MGTGQRGGKDRGDNHGGGSGCGCGAVAAAAVVPTVSQ
jgi:hypothetical protein